MDTALNPLAIIVGIFFLVALAFGFTKFAG